MGEIYDPRSLPSVAVGEEEVVPVLWNILLLHASPVWSRFCPAAFPVASCPTRQLWLSVSKFSPAPATATCLGTSLMSGSCLRQVSEICSEHPVLHIKHSDL